MRNTVIALMLSVLCVLGLCGCADSAGDGVLIVPSSRQTEALRAADEDRMEPKTETDAISSEAVLPAETETAEPEYEGAEPSVTENADDLLAAAEQMLDTDEFRALLEQYSDSGAADDRIALAAAVLAYQRSRQTASGDAASENTDGAEVYWTDGGTVWHVSAECSALAKSKSVHAGSEDAARQSGKTRLCKRCGS